MGVSLPFMFRKLRSNEYSSVRMEHARRIHNRSIRVMLSRRHASYGSLRIQPLVPRCQPYTVRTSSSCVVAMCHHFHSWLWNLNPDPYSDINNMSGGLSYRERIWLEQA